MRAVMGLGVVAAVLLVVLICLGWLDIHAAPHWFSLLSGCRSVPLQACLCDSLVKLCLTFYTVFDHALTGQQQPLFQLHLRVAH